MPNQAAGPYYQINLTNSRLNQSLNATSSSNDLDFSDQVLHEQRDNDSEPEIADSTPLPVSTTTAINCKYECSRYIYSQPITRLSYDSLTNEQREVMKQEYYQGYDFMIGVRTAASLGGAIALFSLFILYKTKCGSDRKRRPSSSASSGGGSSWRRRRPRAAAAEGDPRTTPMPPGGDIDIEKDASGGASGGAPSFAAGGFPALVSVEDRLLVSTGRGGSGGASRRDSRVFFPSTPLTPLSPIAPPTAGADIFQFGTGNARFYERKFSGAVPGTSSGLSTYHDAPRLSCGNILPAAFHRAMPRRAPPSPCQLESACVLLHYSEISPRPYPPHRKGSSGAASSSSCGAAIPSSAVITAPPVIRQQQHQLHMPPIAPRMKGKRKCAGPTDRLGGLGSDPIDIQIIQPTPNVSPCGSTRRLSEDFVTVHAAAFGGPRRTLSGGSRPRSRSDNAPGAGPLIPLLAIPKVHRGSGHHHHAKCKSVKAKRFRDNSTQMSFETQDGGAGISGESNARERANSAHASSAVTESFAHVPTTSAATSSSATSPMGAPLSRPEIVSSEDVCADAASTAAPFATNNSGGVAGGGGIRFIDCSDSDGFSLSSDSGAFGCGSIDSDKPPGSPLNWSAFARRSPGGAVSRAGLHARGSQEVTSRQSASSGTDAAETVVPFEDKSLVVASGGDGADAIEVIVSTCVVDTLSSGGASRRKLISTEPDTAVSETQC